MNRVFVRCHRRRRPWYGFGRVHRSFDESRQELIRARRWWQTDGSVLRGDVPNREFILLAGHFWSLNEQVASVRVHGHAKNVWTIGALMASPTWSFAKCPEITAASSRSAVA